MKTTKDPKNTTESLDTDTEFYESVLRERSPLTGEIPPPRYSLLPKPITADTEQEKGTEAFTIPGRKSWTWLAAAVLLAVLIMFLTLSNTTNAVGSSEKDGTETAPLKK